MSRAVRGLVLASLVLLPWGWFPPLPRLGAGAAHAQWSDLLVAAAAALWAVGWLRARPRPRLRLRPVHLAALVYLAAGAGSLLFSGAPLRAGAWQLAGMVVLALLGLLSAALARQPGGARAIGWSICVTSLATGAAALLGVALFAGGVPTRLCGTFGDLVPGPYARAEAGLVHPNLLGSLCIFASAVVARPESELPRPLRRATQALLTLTVLLTFSRAILGFVLAAAVRAADSRGRRALAVAVGAAGLAAIVTLTVGNLALAPAQPWTAHFEPTPSSRRQAITSAARTFLAHPLWGAGPATHPGWRGALPFDAHLTPLQIGATLGLPALLAFLALPILLFRARRRPTDRALWGGLGGLALDALAQDVAHFRHLWLLFGLADADREPAPSGSPAGQC